jgi:predicted RNA-binding protein with PIN domain
MALLIDGHNLIGAGVFHDIRLSDEDDEAKLVARLKVWKSRYRGKITVIFDRGVPGGWDRRLSGGGVEVIFAADPVQADDLIRRRLRKRTRNLELISNDNALQGEADAAGVSWSRGEQFVERFTLAAPDAAEPGTELDVRWSESEVDEWLGLFRAGPPPTSQRDFGRRRKP